MPDLKSNWRRGRDSITIVPRSAWQHNDLGDNSPVWCGLQAFFDFGFRPLESIPSTLWDTVRYHWYHPA